MPRMSAESRARAKATRKANQAGQPLHILAKILKVKPETLRARLLYHGRGVTGATLADLAQTLKEKTRGEVSAAQWRKINAALGPHVVALDDAAAEPQHNPRAKKAAEPAAPAGMAQRQQTAVQQLRRLKKKWILPKIAADNYTPVDYGLLEVLDVLEGKA